MTRRASASSSRASIEYWTAVASENATPRYIRYIPRYVGAPTSRYHQDGASGSTPRPGTTGHPRMSIEKPTRATAAVSWAGKVTTAVALVGFSMLILGWPILPGLGVMPDAPSWLPGLGSTPTYLGIYLMYLGVAFSLAAAVEYTVKARVALAEARRASAAS